LNVIRRFEGVAWKTLSPQTKEEFQTELKELGSILDRAQHRAAELDKRWQSLRQDDLGGRLRVEDWWQEATQVPGNQPERIQVVMRAFEEARNAMKDAEVPLRKWVIRHLRAVLSAAEAFADLLKKHHQLVGFMAALEERLGHYATLGLAGD
jgi:hypothetical protein